MTLRFGIITGGFLVAIVASSGCHDLFSRIGVRTIEEGPIGVVPDDLATTDTDSETAEIAEIDLSLDESVQRAIDDEEAAMEDQAALNSLIALLVARSEESTEPPKPSPRPSNSSSSGGRRQTEVPRALVNWHLSTQECLNLLEDFGVEVEKVDFATPLVEGPVLLDGPIEGVSVEPRWPRESRVNEVMDCRLVLALVAVAREAGKRGVRKIQFYSTYRPLKVPPADCSPGKKGKKCRELVEQYQRARKSSKTSQHRRAMAIDIRWFELEDGSVIDVLDDFVRRDRHPPCDSSPPAGPGRVLRDFACALYDLEIFNVMLTPNADRAHHNHFHFDISPGADWHIIR